MDERAFARTFQALTAHEPFPWQRRLFELFAAGDWEHCKTCTLPTGLGKTSVIPIWLIALAESRDIVPRRLVYAVNRRTVVDQTTIEVERLRRALKPNGNEALRELRESLHGLRGPIPATEDDPPLAISTLRGQFADNREWSADPARPAVIVGTVDMIGSRLLFSGYGVGFKARPLHAGFLGQDSLIVHDEAHLEPAFQRLLETIEAEQNKNELRRPSEFRPMHVVQLTATARGKGAGNAERAFKLEADDHANATVRQRVEAKKHLALHSVGDDAEVADEIAKRALDLGYAKLDSKMPQPKDVAVLIFVRTLGDVDNIQKSLVKAKVPEKCICQLTGTLRGKERDELAKQNAVFMRFLPDKNRNPDVPLAEGTVYLICTSAGEVGIDISADHMVCDLSTLESIAQRLGRVNRYGEGAANVTVVYPTTFSDKDQLRLARQTTLEYLRRLERDASPKALSALFSALSVEEREAAFTPLPTILPATDILFDAWSLTSIKEKMPGRPPVEKYLHGIGDWEPHVTHVAWREEVEILSNPELREFYEPAELLAEFPLKPHELIRDATDRKNTGVFAHLSKIAELNPEEPVWIVDAQNQVIPTTMKALVDGGSEMLYDAHVLLPPSVGGLTPAGMLDGGARFDKTIAYDVADEWYEDKERTKKRRERRNSDSREPVRNVGMRPLRTIDRQASADDCDDDNEAPNRYWHWYVRPRSSDDDQSRTAVRAIPWKVHVGDVVRETKRILAGLSLPDEIGEAVLFAAKFHDHGKQRRAFQLMLGNSRHPDPEELLAKSGRRGVSFREIYRHEFGSLCDVLHKPEFKVELQELPDEMQDLALHLIAAHHGRARPHFTLEESIDAEGPASVEDAESVACETPRRFARLQRRYGRWGLAYLESLLRAADWAASANPSPNGNHAEYPQ